MTNKTDRFMNNIIELILKHYRVVLIGILIVSIPLGYFYSRQKYFNNINIYFDEGDTELRTYKQFQKTYGNEELLVMAFSDGDILTEKNISIIHRISSSLEGRQGVQRIFSLTEATEAVSTGDTITFSRIIDMDSLSSATLPFIKKKIFSNPLLINNLISADGKTAAIVIELTPVLENNEKLHILNDLKAQAVKAAGSGIRLRFAGQPILEARMNDLTRKDNLRFTPIMLLFIFFILRLSLKKTGLSVLVLATLILTIVWGLGLLTLSGETMNMTTVVIPPVLLAISVADAIHILSHYREIYMLNGHKHLDAVRTAVKDVWLPCLFTSLTTAIGFFSFVTATIRPPKIVGIFTSIGVIIAYLLTITMIPAALIMLEKFLGNEPVTPGEEERVLSESRGIDSPFTTALVRLGSFITSHHRAVFIFLVIIMAVSVYGMSRLRIETSFANYLPEHDELSQDIKYIDKNLGGTIPFVMLIQARTPDHDFSHPESLQLLSDIQNDLMKKLPHFSSTFSIADYFKEINRAFNDGDEKYYRIPHTRTDVLDYWELAEPEILDHAVAPDMMEARISFQSRWGSNALAKKYNAMIISYMKEKLGAEYSYKITGISSLYLSMGNNLQRSQIKSFLSAFIIIFIMMYFVCGNLRLAIISMIPNLFPIMLTLGLMGIMNIPLDIVTIMIASVVIGIAVDDTIHYIVWLKRNCEAGMDVREALIKSYRDTGKPIVITSAVLAFGFFILVLGAVRPTQTFGVLTAFSMATALFGDIVILPALIRLFRPPIIRTGK